MEKKAHRYQDTIPMGVLRCPLTQNEQPLFFYLSRLVSFSSAHFSVGNCGTIGES